MDLPSQSAVLDLRLHQGFSVTSQGSWVPTKASSSHFCLWMVVRLSFVWEPASRDPLFHSPAVIAPCALSSASRKMLGYDSPRPVCCCAQHQSPHRGPRDHDLLVPPAPPCFWHSLLLLCLFSHTGLLSVLWTQVTFVPWGFCMCGFLFLEYSVQISSWPISCGPSDFTSHTISARWFHP